MLNEFMNTRNLRRRRFDLTWYLLKYALFLTTLTKTYERRKTIMLNENRRRRELFTILNMDRRLLKKQINNQ